MNTYHHGFAILIWLVYLLLFGEYVAFSFFSEQMAELLATWPETIPKILARLNSILRPAAPIMYMLYIMAIPPDTRKKPKDERRISSIFLLFALFALGAYYSLVLGN